MEYHRAWIMVLCILCIFNSCDTWDSTIHIQNSRWNRYSLYEDEMLIKDSRLVRSILGIMYVSGIKVCIARIVLLIFVIIRLGFKWSVKAVIKWDMSLVTVVFAEVSNCINAVHMLSLNMAKLIPMGQIMSLSTPIEWSVFVKYLCYLLKSQLQSITNQIRNLEFYYVKYDATKIYGFDYDIHVSMHFLFLKP